MKRHELIIPIDLVRYVSIPFSEHLMELVVLKGGISCTYDHG
jgi:hypothetical protein